ncbi:hypothetical protein C1M51_17825 [Methylibium sp. Pch-M]|uniref:hypothetical protein n=2 Tax=unclassified Methylibium TaxID=2633235 RepID=UPI0010134CA4|nr:hypothetical protein [Methylibium sp. Pch-M]QAZ41127.1 hypothetical protein C1M51_17825 [Methylibium sp. Pch-M]
MSCTEESSARRTRWHAARLGAALALTLGACSTTAPPTPKPSPAPARPAAPVAPAPSAGALPAPEAPRTLAGLRLQAARRLVAANPGMTYSGEVPEPLLAIPVLEVELNADGSVRRIEVLREPRQAKDTIQLSIDAVRRAAPFGDVSKLPRPWKFTETFLFRDDRKFKPRTLDS